LWVDYLDSNPALLLERARELAVLKEATAEAARGTPGVVVIEGPAGIGKTSLLRAARHEAGSLGLRVLAARGGELERGLELGVARQLFEPLLLRASGFEPAELFGGFGGAAAHLFGFGSSKPGPGPDEYASMNALYRLCMRLADHSPVMVVIDDLQWSDAASLRWLAYLARRLEDQPLLLMLAWRSDEAGPSGDVLARIAGEPGARRIRPHPLSAEAVGELAQAMFGVRPQDRFVRACLAAAGGNPLFTAQLLEAAQEEGLRPIDRDAGALSELAPEGVSELVLNRLRRLSPAAVTVAAQVAVLGSRAEVRHVAALSVLGADQVLEAGDELAAAGLLQEEQPFEFVHPVIGSAVYQSVPAGRRAAGHRRAAQLLAGNGAAPSRVAMHLLKTPPAGDRWAAGILRAAAAAEMRPQARVGYLRRALAETPGQSQAEVLLALGQAEALVYDAQAIGHLREALHRCQDPGQQAIAAGRLAICLVEHDRTAEVDPMLRAAMTGLPVADPGSAIARREPLLTFQVALLESGLHAARLSMHHLNEAVTLAGEGRSPAERELLGMAAYAAPAAGAAASEVAELARRALREADLSTVDGLRLIACPVWALEAADRLDEADRWLLRIQDAAQRSGWPSQFILAASSRAEACCRRGALADAEQDAMAALDLADAQSSGYGGLIASAALVIALTEQGRLAEADRVAAGAAGRRGPKCDRSVYVLSRGWLRLATGRADDATREFQEAGRLTAAAGHDFPGFWPWRVGAVAALLALGRRKEAAVLAHEQLELTRRFGAAGPTGIALRTLGLAQRGTAQLELLAAACDELNRSPALLERAKTQLEYGAALRRAGHRTDSRQPLRIGLDLATRCGAAPVARRAREELGAAGGRPRRTRIYGIQALTASELRVARRAADGRTNREIAQELFVTMKAVEKHLASVYRKLGVEGRATLAGRLANEPQIPVPAEARATAPG
jgi:DNA-binding CsgD family transcriptional regulator